MTEHTRLQTNDQHPAEEKRTEITNQDTFAFDCEYCDEVLQTTTIETMKDRGTTHLEIHISTLLEAFADKTRGKHCQNDCGYTFPVGVDEVTGFDCPQCGYDNFEAFAHRYLYWEIEYP